MKEEKFKKYSEIENLNLKYIEKIREKNLDKRKYVVTEKIDGANFQIFIDDELFLENDILFGKRKSFLPKDFDFFNYQRVMEKLNIKEKVIKLYDYLKKEFGNEIESLRIYGELFGKDIQRRIYYGDDKYFIAFDLMINDRYLSFKEMYDLLVEFDIPVIEPLCICENLDEALVYSNTFNSTIPEILGIEKEKVPENNVAEGIVIKPYDEVFYIGNWRVILKNKNEKFKEKHKSYKHSKEKIREEKLEQEEIEIYQKIILYINRNRLLSAVSKIGDERRYFKEIFEEFKNDVYKDFYKENPEFKDRKFSKNFVKSVNRQISKLIVEYFESK